VSDFLYKWKTTPKSPGNSSEHAAQIKTGATVDVRVYNTALTKRKSSPKSPGNDNDQIIDSGVGKTGNKLVTVTPIPVGTRLC
jgi:hypothetical protein